MPVQAVSADFVNTCFALLKSVVMPKFSEQLATFIVDMGKFLLSFFGVLRVIYFFIVVAMKGVPEADPVSEKELLVLFSYDVFLFYLVFEGAAFVPTVIYM